MNKIYDVYLCRSATETKSVLLQIYEEIARWEAIHLGVISGKGLTTCGGKIVINRPKPYIKKAP